MCVLNNIMRKLIIILILFIVCSCGRTTFSGQFEPTNQYWVETEYPQLVIDSICKADTLSLDVKDFRKWNKSEFFTSDSVIQKSYYFYDDSLNISISVTEDVDNKYSVKYMK